METVFNWVISQMDERPQEGNLYDVVVVVHWRRQGIRIVDGTEYFAETFGAYTCPTPSDIDFTSYPDLTFEQVCSWLDAGLDVPELDAIIDLKIDNLINPPIINLPFPWAPTTTTTTTTEAPVTTSTTTTTETTLA
jgi:hypothetical protein